MRNLETDVMSDIKSNCNEIERQATILDDISKKKDFTIEEIETQAEEVRQVLDRLNDCIEKYRVAKKHQTSGGIL